MMNGRGKERSIKGRRWERLSPYIFNRFTLWTCVLLRNFTCAGKTVSLYLQINLFCTKSFENVIRAVEQCRFIFLGHAV